MRLIDADALAEVLGIKEECAECEHGTEIFCTKGSDFVDACEAIFDAPTIDVPDRKVGKWIPCKKRMPKPNEVVGNVTKYYLVQTEYGDMMVASYNAEGDARWWEQMCQYEVIMDEIVAWMELPEEYKERSEE